MDNNTVADLVRLKTEPVAIESVERQFSITPGLQEKYGPQGKARSVEDARHNLSSLADAIELDSPPMFTSYVSWLSILLNRLGLNPEHLVRHFEILETILAGEMPGQAAGIISEYIKEGMKHAGTGKEADNTLIDDDNPHRDLAARYLSLLLKGKKNEASSLIVSRADQGMPVKDIYLHVFQPVQHEIGRLWQTNRLSVGEEHYATAITQLTISMLYPYIFNTERNGLKMISTTVSSELHELGIRMVTDLFESEGWDTWFLGANTPAESIIKLMKEHQPDILAISVTLPGHIKRMQNLACAIKEKRPENTKIIVGGQAFRDVPGAWIKKHADGYSDNAGMALSMVYNLIGKS